MTRDIRNETNVSGIVSVDQELFIFFILWQVAIIFVSFEV